MSSTSSSEVADLETLRPFIELVANERSAGNNSRRDDAVQEGLLVAWQTRHKPLVYRRQAAKRALTTALTRDAWTGSERPHGAPTDPLRNNQREEFDMDRHDSTLQPAYGVLGADLTALHRAVRDLPYQERCVVLWRFWGGCTEQETAVKLGMSAKTVNNLWNRNTKPFLRERLAHLNHQAA